MRFPEWITNPFEIRREQATSKVSLWRSPLGVFILFGVAFAIAITLAHLFVDTSLSLLPPLPLWAEELLETAATLILLLSPFYLLVLQPLGRYIADRAEAAAALRVSEQQLSRIFDTAAEVIYLHTVEQDGHYRFAAVNRAFQTVTGLAPGQVVGKRVDEVIPQPSLTFVLEKYQEAIREKRIVHWEETSEYPTGRLVGEVSVAPIFNDVGVCTHLVGTVHDITERKRSEEALQKSEERYRTIVEGIQDVVYRVRGDPLKGIVEFVSPRVSDILGYRAEDFYKDTELWFRSLHPEDVARVIEETQRIVAGSSNHQRTYRIRRKGSEEYRWIEDNVSLVLDSGGNIIGIDGVARDVTEQKQIQAQLMQSDRLATVGSVVSGIAHEVNNPLAGALGRADLVLRGNLDDALKKDIEVIRSEIWRAALTVRQLLSFAREHKPEKISVSINETLEATLTLRTYELTVANIQVVKDLQPDLPAAMADRNQLQQVFLNIILNAEQAMSTAHGRGTLSLRTRQMGRTIVVTIADDGPGISPEHLPKVFDPFFTTKPVGQGTGLGLSVSYGIIQAHGGTIRAASEMGKGATFTVVLPVSTDGLSDRSP